MKKMVARSTYRLYSVQKLMKKSLTLCVFPKFYKYDSLYLRKSFKVTVLCFSVKLDWAKITLNFISFIA